MRVINDLAELEQAGLRRVVAALGNFDGVHLGHRELIRAAVSRAEQSGGQSAVVTFVPHPLKVLAPDKSPKLLTTLPQRLRHFEALGVDVVILLPFTLELAALSPVEFVRRILREKLDTVHVFVGFNYSFGHGATGGPDELAELGEELGFGVSVVEPRRVDGVIVSSTLIRGALERGDIDEVEKFLGYWPSVPGIVVKGDRRGRTIGYPTANVEPPGDLLIPARGVYAAWVSVSRDSMYPAMVNIGAKPTFKDWSEDIIEAHIFDFDQDIYGQTVEVFFRRRLRHERKFASVGDLLRQLEKDKITSYSILKKDNLPELSSKKQIL